MNKVDNLPIPNAQEALIAATQATVSTLYSNSSLPDIAFRVQIFISSIPVYIDSSKNNSSNLLVHEDFELTLHAFTVGFDELKKQQKLNNAELADLLENLHEVLSKIHSNIPNYHVIGKELYEIERCFHLARCAAGDQGSNAQKLYEMLDKINTVCDTGKGAIPYCKLAVDHTDEFSKHSNEMGHQIWRVNEKITSYDIDLLKDAFCEVVHRMWHKSKVEHLSHRAIVKINIHRDELEKSTPLSARMSRFFAFIICIDRIQRDILFSELVACPTKYAVDQMNLKDVHTSVLELYGTVDGVEKDARYMHLPSTLTKVLDQSRDVAYSFCQGIVPGMLRTFAKLVGNTPQESLAVMLLENSFEELLIKILFNYSFTEPTKIQEDFARIVQFFAHEIKELKDHEKLDNVERASVLKDFHQRLNNICRNIPNFHVIGKGLYEAERCFHLARYAAGDQIARRHINAQKLYEMLGKINAVCASGKGSISDYKFESDHTDKFSKHANEMCHQFWAVKQKITSCKLDTLEFSLCEVVSRMWHKSKVEYLSHQAIVKINTRRVELEKSTPPSELMGRFFAFIMCIHRIQRDILFPEQIAYPTKVAYTAHQMNLKDVYASLSELNSALKDFKTRTPFTTLPSALEDPLEQSRDVAYDFCQATVPQMLTTFVKLAQSTHQDVAAVKLLVASFEEILMKILFDHSLTVPTRDFVFHILRQMEYLSIIQKEEDQGLLKETFDRSDPLLKDLALVQLLRMKIQQLIDSSVRAKIHWGQCIWSNRLRWILIGGPSTPPTNGIIR